MMTGWSTIHEFTKTVVTLSVAFLGLTITFSKDLLGREAALENKEWLFASWLFLGLAITAALLSTAYLANYLRRRSDDNIKPVFYANLSYFSLFAGAIVMIVFSFKSFSDTTAVTTKDRLEYRLDSIQNMLIKSNELDQLQRQKIITRIKEIENDLKKLSR